MSERVSGRYSECINATV
uniref:Uncharacterized protein n=1 Tax=Anguilla anguilla TaxID=7936 RepID=A0A0E9P798_ANGAN